MLVMLCVMLIHA
ncbi:hypothetical protein HU200_030822 [Digitaria exilis]|uniref:Uncharacterized protein n=1 Tax=Digitaria exilis TaxID=1010633 RepID=A0A835ETV5_9POAL|nr:hypothetical protein HU200_030822 [Digitaria exilis]